MVMVSLIIEYLVSFIGVPELRCYTFAKNKANAEHQTFRSVIPPLQATILASRVPSQATNARGVKSQTPLPKLHATSFLTGEVLVAHRQLCTTAYSN
jgi:hypothetical protein